MKYKVALFIGRFQPFHNGHLYSLKKASELGEKVIVGVGSSNVINENNPWDYETRRSMVEAVVEEEGLGDKMQAIWAIPDDPSDEEWVDFVKLKVESEKLKINEVVVVSNNTWVTELLEKAGFPVFKTGFYNRDELEGVKIREMMRNGEEKWQERVPEGVEVIVNRG